MVENVLKRVKDMFHSEGHKLPNHIAISTSGVELWAKENKKGIDEANKKGFENLLVVLKEQIELKIPVITVFLLREDMDKDSEHFKVLIDSMEEFLLKLRNNEEIHNNKIKISIIGKWYNLPSRIVEPIKEVVAATSEYDQYSLNFCINYDGQEEITDACKLIARQVASGKLQAESITKEDIKGNLYSSKIPSVDLIIKNGKERSTRGVLLWDSKEARIYFSNRLWPDFSKSDLLRALES
ncbi:polyprenyl diphosphate synthase [Nanoarchaeota archaeon]